MNKKIINLIIVIAFIFCLCGCNNSKTAKAETNKTTEKENNVEVKEDVKLNILVCDKFLYNCVKSVDGSKHNVDYIFSESSDEFNVKYYFYDTQNTPDLFIFDEYNFMNSSNSYINRISSSKVGIINSTRGINTMPKYKNVTTIGEVDNSCYWNNIENLRIVLLNVQNSIIERDPMNRNYYTNNFNNVVDKLKEYDEYFSKQFIKLSDYTFIVQEDSLNYFMGYSGLNTLAISNDSIEDEESSKKNIDKLINNYIDNECQDKNKIILIYYDNNFIKQHKSIIDKYNIKTYRCKQITQENSFESVFKYETNFIDNIVKNCNTVEK